MVKPILLLALAALAFAADDPWSKVKELKTGTELQVYKRGAAQPLTVKMDELTDDNLVVIEKKSQTAIPREQIERIDARSSGKPHAVTETKTRENNAATDPRSTIPGPNSPPGAMNGTSTSTSTGVSWGKPGFETVYRRTASAASKK